MKKAILTFVIVLSVSIFASAQQANQKFNPFSLEALQEVKANDQQIKQFKALVKDYDAKRKAINRSATLSEDEKRAEFKKLNQYRNKAYWQEILTKEQAATLREKQKAANDSQ